MTCLLKWEPGATLPMRKHPQIEQTVVLEGSFYDHDGICRAGRRTSRRRATPRCIMPSAASADAVATLYAVTDYQVEEIRQIGTDRKGTRVKRD